MVYSMGEPSDRPSTSAVAIVQWGNASGNGWCRKGRGRKGWISESVDQSIRPSWTAHWLGTSLDSRGPICRARGSYAGNDFFWARNLTVLPSLIKGRRFRPDSESPSVGSCCWPHSSRAHFPGDPGLAGPWVLDKPGFPAQELGLSFLKRPYSTVHPLSASPP